MHGFNKASDAQPTHQAPALNIDPAKVTRLPSNGPKAGQSTRSWQQGKDLGDHDWAQKSIKAAVPRGPRRMYGGIRRPSGGA